MHSSRMVFAELPDLLPRGSADTGNAGTESGQSGQRAPQVKAAGNALPAKQHAPQERAEGVPLVYRTGKVREAVRRIRDAVIRQPKDVHYLRLTEREFLTVYSAVEHDRNRTMRAIRKGIADPQDLKASDSTWQALQLLMVRRMKGYRL